MVGRRIIGTARAASRLRHPLGRALVLRDLSSYLRLQCLGAIANSGLGQALRTPGSAAELAARAGLVDVDLTTALLDTGVGFHLVRRRGATYSARGARLRAMASGRAPDVAGLAEEATAYDGPIYAALPSHLHGRGPAPYLDGMGDVIARASRIAEPLAGPWLAARAAGTGARRVLDVGCGSGVNLRWLAEALPEAQLHGVDLEADAVAGAQANLAAWGLDHRVRVAQADLRDLPQDLGGPWDLIVLAQNIYYWPVDERTALLGQLRSLLGEAGTLLLVTGVPGRSGVGRHLDLVLRVTEGCDRLPTMDELRTHADAAGFGSVRVRDLAPGLGMAGLVATSR